MRQVTDSTPDDKNLTDEDATTEETVQDAVESGAGTDDAAETPTEKVSTEKVPTTKAPAATKRAVRPSEEADDAEADDAEEEAPARRRPVRTARERAASAAGGTSGGTLVTVVSTVVVIALLAGTIVFGLLWNSKRNEVNELKSAAADKAQAEKVAANYAAGSSTFDYRDLGPWRTAVTTGVSPEVKAKYDALGGAMNQLFQPLQWVSKGTVLDAVVNSQSGPIYKVSAYVRVEATNVQAPGGREVVSVYNVTLDKDKDWQITDVGGAVDTPNTLPTQTAPAPTEGAQTPAATPAPGN
jgi:Mce-associated membrane protein